MGVRGIYKKMQSAGNLQKILDSEDLIKTNKILNEEEKKEMLDYVSDHNKYHKDLLDDDNYFGYYLAGLIEGDGCFERNRLTICYHEKDVAAAYWLKKRIGYGVVQPVKGKRAVSYFLTGVKGMRHVLDITNGKFVTDFKLDQMKKYNYDIKYDIQLMPKNPKPDLKNNYFLAGFFDADGCLLISIKKRVRKNGNEHTTILTKLKIALKSADFLDFIKIEFGGYLGQATRGEWCYESSSFKVAYEFIKYFDKYSLVSTKYIEYLKWRDCYRIVQKKEHLTEQGLEKIKKLKKDIDKIRS